MPDDTNTPETTTAPEAVTEPTTEQVETFDREYVEKLRKENATYRTKAKKAEEAAEAAKLAAEREKLDEVERLKAEKADAEKRAAEIEARAVAAERRAALTERVNDVDLALAVADEYATDDGSLDVDALLAAHPSLAKADTKRVNLPGQRTTPGPKGDLTAEDFRNKPPAWVRENLHRLKPPK